MRSPILSSQAHVRDAVRHLIANGHRKIAYICSDDAAFADEKDRMAGYKMALEEAGIEFDPNIVSAAFPDENGGYRAIESLLMRDAGFTAFVAYNDAMAIGAISALADNNIAVPGQVSAVGYDDNPISNYIKPKLTTVRYPIEEVGKRAATLALSLLYDRSEEFNWRWPLKFTPVLIEKASVTQARPEEPEKKPKKAAKKQS